MLLKVTQLNCWLLLLTEANRLICLIVFGQLMNHPTTQNRPSTYVSILSVHLCLNVPSPCWQGQSGFTVHDHFYTSNRTTTAGSVWKRENRELRLDSFPSFRPATTGSAPSQRPWLATMFAICTMRAWSVKMATVLIEKQRWHIPFCARNKTEPFTNPHIRKVGTSTCWSCSFLFFSCGCCSLINAVCVCIWACA